MSNLSRRDPLLLQWSAMNQIAVNNCIDKSPFLPRSFPPPPSSRPPFSLRKFHKSRPSVTAMGALCNCCMQTHATIVSLRRGKGKEAKLYYAYSLAKHTDLSSFSESQKSKKNRKSYIIIHHNTMSSKNIPKLSW